jgi:hypothetical protein
MSGIQRIRLPGKQTHQPAHSVVEREEAVVKEGCKRQALKGLPETEGGRTKT